MSSEGLYNTTKVMKESSCRTKTEIKIVYKARDKGQRAT